MTHGITWRTAGTVEKKRDAVAMRTFTCATPRSGDKYPPDFEDEVQRHFRQRAITAANTARDRGSTAASESQKTAKASPQPSPTDGWTTPTPPRARSCSTSLPATSPANSASSP